MLIEDQQNVRSTLRDILRSTGDFRTAVTLGSEAEALGWIDHHPSEWDFAVIDLVLDQGNAFSVIERARAAAPHARIVVLTGFATTGMRHHCKQLGADAFFDKADLPSFLGYCHRYSPPTELGAQAGSA